MSSRLLILPLAGTLVLGSAASADLKEVGPGHFSCDAPAGKYDELAMPELQPRKPVTVAIRYISEHPGSKWGGAARLSFDTPKGRMRLLVGKAQNDQNHIYVQLWSGTFGDVELLEQHPLSPDWIVLTLTLDYDGFLEVRTPKNTAQLNVGTSWHLKPVLHCQSGAFEFQISPPPDSK
jgi:hypothetical protein